MSFIQSALPRAARAFRPAVPIGQQQFQCLYAPTTADEHRARFFFQHQQQRTFHATPRTLSVKNPYNVLGVNKSSSSSEIKKAYYGAAKKFHPDSSKEPNAREKFQEVQSAYEILSDPEKKQQFDQYGEAAFDPNGNPTSGQGFHPGQGSAGGPFSGFGGGAGGFSGFGSSGFGADFSFEDLFNAAAGGAQGRAGKRNPFGASDILVGEDINMAATITFMDAAKGASIEIPIKPLVGCKTCTGSGMKPNIKKRECGRCGGTGTRIHFMHGGFQMAATCETCGGHGVSTPPGGECGTCRGEGVVKENRTVPVDIPAGVEDGMRMRISGEGNAPPSGSIATESGKPPRTKRGDLFVHLTVQPHPKFTRNGSDVHFNSTIPLTTALLGGIIKVPTLDGEVELRVPTGTNNGDTIVMSGMGMKKLGGRRNASGDLRVEFNVNIPKSLTPSQRTLLELLADEFNDKSAKRIMNVSQYANEAASKANGGAAKENDESHHGLLKRVWDKLTHQQQQDRKGGKN